MHKADLIELQPIRQKLIENPWERFWWGYLRAFALDGIENMALILGYQVAEIHEGMIEHVETHPDGSLTLSFRGSGKSTILTIAPAVLEICRNFECRGAIISDTKDQAKMFLSEIMGHLEGNEGLIWLFGVFKVKGKKWDSSKIVIAQRTRVQKEGTLEAHGFDAAVVGRHFDWMLYDDVASEKNSRTEKQRERLLNKHRKKFSPCLEPHGWKRFVGTRYHFSDFYFTLMQEELKDSTYVQRALIIGEDGKERSAWPEKFTVEKLRSIRTNLGTLVFNSQYQNDTEAMKGKIFKYEWMKFCSRADVPEELRIFQGVDLAISEKATADYFAVATAGLEPVSGIWYVLDTYRARTSFRQQKAAIANKSTQFDPVQITVESNQYQAVMAQELQEAGLLRVKAAVTHKDKVTRAMKLSALFEAGRVVFVKGLDTLVDELLGFPQAEHDDLFDALDLAIQSGSVMVIEGKGTGVVRESVAVGERF